MAAGAVIFEFAVAALVGSDVHPWTGAGICDLACTAVGVCDNVCTAAAGAGAVGGRARLPMQPNEVQLAHNGGAPRAVA